MLQIRNALSAGGQREDKEQSVVGKDYDMYLDPFFVSTEMPRKANVFY